MTKSPTEVNPHDNPLLSFLIMGFALVILPAIVLFIGYFIVEAIL